MIQTQGGTALLTTPPGNSIVHQKECGEIGRKLNPSWPSGLLAGSSGEHPASASQDTQIPHQWPQRNVPGILIPKAALFKSGFLLVGPSWDSLLQRTPPYAPNGTTQDKWDALCLWFEKPSSFFKEKTRFVIHHFHCLICCWNTVSSSGQAFKKGLRASVSWVPSNHSSLWWHELAEPESPNTGIRRRLRKQRPRERRALPRLHSQDCNPVRKHVLFLRGTWTWKRKAKCSNGSKTSEESSCFNAACTWKVMQWL